MKPQKKKYSTVLAIVLIIIIVPLSVIGINAYCDRNIVLKVAILSRGTYYYILRSNQVLESYQGVAFNSSFINGHYYLKKIYKEDRTVISEEDYNYLLKYADEVTEKDKLWLGEGDWTTYISYNGKVFTTPGIDDDGFVKELLYKVTGLSSVPFEYRDRYFGR